MVGVAQGGLNNADNVISVYIHLRGQESPQGGEMCSGQEHQVGSRTDLRGSFGQTKTSERVTAWQLLTTTQLELTERLIMGTELARRS